VRNALYVARGKKATFMTALGDIMVNGNVVAIFIAPIAGGKMEEVEIAEAIAGVGLWGDRYSMGEGSFNRGRQGRRQVTLINALFFQDSGFEYAESRRNIVTRGVELMWLIAREFQIGKARFRGQYYCDPCLRPTRLSGKTEKFLEAFSDRGGLVAEVLESGTIRKGDSVIINALPQEAYYYRNRDQRVADLVQSGNLRVGLFLPQYSKDSSTGQLTGVWIETARILASRLGVQLTILEHSTPPEAVASLKNGACDLLFLPHDERAAAIGDFSNPIFQFDYTLLVQAGSSIQCVADADQSGVRIGAVRNHASTNELCRKFNKAKLVYAENPNQNFDLLRTGQADAIASARPTLLEYSTQLSGSQVLADCFGANINRMLVLKGKAGWLTYLNEFIEDAKALGLVQNAIERGGTRGVRVAPSANVVAP
jgi:polar amino acid transport system substrate-binding protein